MRFLMGVGVAGVRVRLCILCCFAWSVCAVGAQTTGLTDTRGVATEATLKLLRYADRSLGALKVDIERILRAMPTDVALTKLSVADLKQTLHVVAEDDQALDAAQLAFSKLGQVKLVGVPKYQQLQVAVQLSLRLNQTDLIAAINAQEARSPYSYRALISDQQKDAVVADILQARLGNSLESGYFLVLTPVQERGVVAHPIQLRATGAVRDILGFLQSLSNLPYLLAAWDADLSVDKSQVQLNIRLWAFESSGVATPPGQMRETIAAATLRESVAREFPTVLGPFDLDRAVQSTSSGTGRAREPLEAFALSDIEVFGVLGRGASSVALVRHGASVYQLRVGGYLGQNQGRVEYVSDTEITLREKVAGPDGKSVERLVTLPVTRR